MFSSITGDVHRRGRLRRFPCRAIEPAIGLHRPKTGARHGRFAVANEISFVTGDYWEIWPTNYHRWHSPVAGTIVRAFTKDGTYYSEGADAVEPTNSQSYLAHVAARAIILIDADDPVIGLIAFVRLVCRRSPRA
jgi:hypothetical protein